MSIDGLLDVKSRRPGGVGGSKETVISGCLVARNA